MLLLIDNYDSFTWNLYQYFCELGAEVRVVRNDAITLAEMDALPLTQLVISPGPILPVVYRFSVFALAIRRLRKPMARRWCAHAR